MKKIFSLVLIAIMVLSLCACAKETSPNPPLKVGFGRASIHPDQPIPLAGYFDVAERVSQGALDLLYATCVAIQDAKGNTVLLYSMDLIRTPTSWVPDLRAAISKATGVPDDRIMLSATHTHSAPDVGGTVGMGHPYYAKILKPGLVEAGKSAMEDLSAATIQTGSTKITGMNNNRHWIDEDGMYFGGNFGSKAKKDTAKISAEADNQLQLIRFCREKQKDILLVNWQAHPKLSSGGGTEFGRTNRPLISADYVGWTRHYLEEKTDVHFAFYLGASGNVNPYDAYTGTSDPSLQDVRVYGERFSTYIMEAMEGLTATEIASVKSSQYQFPGVTPSGSTADIEINAITVGSIGFVTVPYEMFDTNGCTVKEQSPLNTTFVITCANGRHKYMPADYVWDYPTADGSVAYEVSSCLYVRGTGEQVADALVEALNELAGK